MPEVKTAFGDGSSMSSGMRVIENGCMTCTVVSHSSSLCKLCVTGAVCTHVNNPFAAAEFLLPAGVAACLAQALHLGCLPLAPFRSASRECSAGGGLGNSHSPLLPQTAVAWILQDSRARLPMLGWRNTYKSLFSLPGEKTSRSREKQEILSSSCCPKNKRGPPRQNSCRSMVGE